MFTLNCCKCFQLRCPFQDFNEPGCLLCLGLSPTCAVGTAEQVQEGEALGWSGWGWGGSLAWGTDCVPRLQMPPPAVATLPGNRQTGPVLPRDEKFCMAGCGEKQRQSGWSGLRKRRIAVLAVQPSGEAPHAIREPGLKGALGPRVEMRFWKVEEAFWSLWHRMTAGAVIFLVRFVEPAL